MIVKNITMKYKFISIFSLALFIAACGESTPDDESLVYISDTQFNFHQNTNQLYISTKVQPDLNGQALDKVIVEWYGTSLDSTPDSLTLIDDGTNGDIISFDNIYTLKAVSYTHLTLPTILRV